MDTRRLFILVILVTSSLAAPRDKRNVGQDTTVATDVTEKPEDAQNDATVKDPVAPDTEPTPPSEPEPNPDDDVSGGHGDVTGDDDVSGGGHGEDKPHVYGLDHGEELTENHTIVCQWGHCWVVKPDPPPKYSTVCHHTETLFIIILYAVLGMTSTRVFAEPNINNIYIYIIMLK